MVQVPIASTPITPLTVTANGLAQGLLQNRALKERLAKMRAEQEQREFDQQTRLADIENERERIKQSAQLRREEMKLAEKRYEQEREMDDRREERLTRASEANIQLGTSREERGWESLRGKEADARAKADQMRRTGERNAMLAKRLGAVNASEQKVVDEIAYWTKAKRDKRSGVPLLDADRALQDLYAQLQEISQDKELLEAALSDPNVPYRMPESTSEKQFKRILGSRTAGTSGFDSSLGTTEAPAQDTEQREPYPVRQRQLVEPVEPPRPRTTEPPESSVTEGLPGSAVAGGAPPRPPTPTSSDPTSQPVRPITRRQLQRRSQTTNHQVDSALFELTSAQSQLKGLGTQDHRTDSAFDRNRRQNWKEASWIQDQRTDSAFDRNRRHELEQQVSWIQYQLKEMTKPESWTLPNSEALRDPRTRDAAHREYMALVKAVSSSGLSDKEKHQRILALDSQYERALNPATFNYYKKTLGRFTPDDPNGRNFAHLDANRALLEYFDEWLQWREKRKSNPKAPMPVEFGPSLLSGAALNPFGGMSAHKIDKDLSPRDVAFNKGALLEAIDVLERGFYSQIKDPDLRAKMDPEFLKALHRQFYERSALRPIGKTAGEKWNNPHEYLAALRKKVLNYTPPKWGYLSGEKAGVAPGVMVRGSRTENVPIRAMNEFLSGFTLSGSDAVGFSGPIREQAGRERGAGLFAGQGGRMLGELGALIVGSSLLKGGVTVGGRTLIPGLMTGARVTEGGGLVSRWLTKAGQKEMQGLVFGSQGAVNALNRGIAQGHIDPGEIGTAALFGYGLGRWLNPTGLYEMIGKPLRTVARKLGGELLEAGGKGAAVAAMETLLQKAKTGEPIDWKQDLKGIGFAGLMMTFWHLWGAKGAIGKRLKLKNTIVKTFARTDAFKARTKTKAWKALAPEERVQRIKEQKALERSISDMMKAKGLQNTWNTLNKVLKAGTSPEQTKVINEFLDKTEKAQVPEKAATTKPPAAPTALTQEKPKPIQETAKPKVKVPKPAKPKKTVPSTQKVPRKKTGGKELAPNDVVEVTSGKLKGTRLTVVELLPDNKARVKLKDGTVVQASQTRLRKVAAKAQPRGTTTTREAPDKYQSILELRAKEFKAGKIVTQERDPVARRVARVEELKAADRFLAEYQKLNKADRAEFAKAYKAKFGKAFKAPEVEKLPEAGPEVMAEEGAGTTDLAIAAHTGARVTDKLPQDYAAQVYGAMKELGFSPRSKYRSRGEKGRFTRSLEGKERVELNDLRHVDVATHEMAHGLDRRLHERDGKLPSSIKKRFPGVQAPESRLRAELQEASRLVRPDLWADTRPSVQKYLKKHTELMADFGALYLMDPAEAARVAPTVTEAYKSSLKRNPEASRVVNALLGRRVGGPAPADRAEEIAARILPGKGADEVTPKMLVEDISSATNRKQLKRAVKDLTLERDRTYKAETIEAQINASRWRKAHKSKRLEDMGAIIENVENLRTKESLAKLKGSLTEAEKRTLNQITHSIELERQKVNQYMRQIGESDWISFLEDYLPHFYRGKKKNIRSFARFWAKQSPSQKQRKLPTLKDAVEAGLEPVTQNAADLYERWADLNWRVATNVMLVKSFKKAYNPEGEPLFMTSKEMKNSKVERVLMDHPAIRKVYGRKDPKTGAFIGWEGGVWVDARVHSELNGALGRPLSGRWIVAFETANNVMKNFLLSYSLFHHVQVHLLSPLASLSKLRNPLRGVVLLGKEARQFGRSPIRLTARVGKQLSEIPELVREAARHGFRYDHPTKEGRQAFDKFWALAVRKTSGVRPLRWTVHPVAKLGQGFHRLWQGYLWNTSNRLKLATWYLLTTEGLKAYNKKLAKTDAPADPRAIKGIKRIVAQHCNHEFGGFEWQQYAFVRNPVVQQVSRALLLAPDWTAAQLAICAEPFGLLRKDAEARFRGKLGIKRLIAFVANTLAITNGANYALTGHSAFENEMDHKYDIDVTKIWRMTQRLLSKVGLADYDPENPGPHRFVGMGKAVREVMRFWENPLRYGEGKMSPVGQFIVRQLFGKTATGIETPWSREGLDSWDKLKARAGDAFEQFKPFVFKENSFLLSGSMSKGMTHWKAQKAYHEVFLAQAKVAAGEFGMHGTKTSKMMARDADAIIAQIERAAKINDLDPTDAKRNAMSEVRRRYYRAFFKAFNAEKYDRAEKYARALVALDTTYSSLSTSVEKRAEIAKRELTRSDYAKLIAIYEGAQSGTTK